MSFIEFTKRHLFLGGIAIVLALACVACDGRPNPAVSGDLSNGLDREPSAATQEAGTSLELVQPTIAPMSAPTKTPTPTVTPQPPPTMEPTPVSLGGLVERDGYSFAAVAVVDPVSPVVFDEEKPAQRWVAVEVIVGNVSGEIFSSDPLQATLLDDKGVEYTPDVGASDSELATVELHSGERVRGWISFLIPEDRFAAAVQYDFGGTPGTKLVSPLGSSPGHISSETSIPLTNGEEPARTLPEIGEPAKLDGYTLRAERVENPSTPGMFFKSLPDTKQVSVYIALGNESGDVISSNPLSAYLLDAEHYVYAADPGGRAGQLESVDLSPGQSIRGWVTFTIPEDSQPAALKFQTSQNPLVELYVSLASGVVPVGSLPTPEAQTAQDGQVAGRPAEYRLIGSSSASQPSVMNAMDS